MQMYEAGQLYDLPDGKGHFGQVRCQADDARGRRSQRHRLTAVVAHAEVGAAGQGAEQGADADDQRLHGAAVLGVKPHCVATPHCQHSGLRAWQT